MYSLKLEGFDKTVALPIERTILDACLDQGAPVPYNCRSGECGECKALLITGEVQELPGADPAIFTDEMRQSGMILTCMCFALSDLQLRVPLVAEGLPEIRQFDSVVREVTWFGDRSARVVVRPNQRIDYHAGQYFEWHVPQGFAPRSYSAANVPGGTDLEFIVRIHDEGAISGLLRRAEIAAGDVLSLRGPFGSWRLDPEDQRPLLLVAGGTGLAPVKAIAETVAASGSRRPVKIFFGARDHAELGYAASLRALADGSPSITLVEVLSHEPAGSVWTGPRGFVPAVLRDARVDAFGAQAYLCGPPQMIGAVAPVLDEMGVMTCDIHCDKFTPAPARG